MKIKRTETRQVAMSQLQWGDPFEYSGHIYIRTNPAIHGLGTDYSWGTRIIDGVLTKFSREDRVLRVNGEFVEK